MKCAHPSVVLWHGEPADFHGPDAVGGIARRADRPRNPREDLAARAELDGERQRVPELRLPRGSAESLRLLIVLTIVLVLVLVLDRSGISISIAQRAPDFDFEEDAEGRTQHPSPGTVV